MTSFLLLARGRGRGPGPEVEPEPEPSGFLFTDSFAGGVYGGNPAGTYGGTEFSWHTRTATIITDPDDETKYAARFRYGPDSPTEDGGDIVNKFWIGQNLNEVFLEFDWEVPSNFAHRVGPNSTANNKLFQIWRDVYSSNPGASMQWGAEFLRLSATESYFKPMTTRSSVSTTGTADVVFHLASGSRFISASGPIVPGQKHNLRFHLRPSSAPGVIDGAWSCWIDGVLFCTRPTVHDLFNRDYAVALGDLDTSVKQGYIMGYSNSGFADQTDFLVRNVRLADYDQGWE